MLVAANNQIRTDNHKNSGAGLPKFVVNRSRIIARRNAQGKGPVGKFLLREGYDNVTSDSARFDAVTHTVKSAVEQPLLLDQLTEQKLQHNRERFWDQKLVTDLVRQEIIHDIQEFLA